MRKAVDRYHAVVRVLAICCGWMLLLFSILTCISSASRYLFNASISGVDEYGGYIFAILGAIAFSFAALERKHIRVELVREHLSERIRSVLDVLSIIMLFLTALLLVWLASVTWMTSLNMKALSSTPIRTPLAVPQGIWLAGLALFAVTTLLMSAYGAILLFRKEFGKVNELLGSESLKEEVERELQDFQSRTNNAKG